MAKVVGLLERGRKKGEGEQEERGERSGKEGGGERKFEFKKMFVVDLYRYSTSEVISAT